MAIKTGKSIKLFGLDLASSSFETLLAELESHYLNSRSTAYIFTPNPEQVVQCQANPRLKRILQSGNILLPDGHGLVWASRILLGPERAIPARITGRELAPSLMQQVLDNGERVLVIGGRDYQVPAHPNLKWLEAYKDVTQPTPTEEKEITAVIEAFQPALILVAFGAPWQEYWVDDHRELVERSGVRLVMVVGGTFDVFWGTLTLPPQWVIKWHLEWLYRLWQEPWRWKRQLRLLEFGWLVLRMKVTRPGG